MDIVSGANSLKATNNGKFYLQFKDGGVIRLYPPSFQATGLMLGRRYINMIESLVLEDINNNLMSVINFTKESKSVFGKLFGSAPKLFPDHVT
jgi:hypothetical protein